MHWKQASNCPSCAQLKQQTNLVGNQAPNNAMQRNQYAQQNGREQGMVQPLPQQLASGPPNVVVPPPGHFNGFNRTELHNAQQNGLPGPVSPRNPVGNMNQRLPVPIDGNAWRASLSPEERTKTLEKIVQMMMPFLRKIEEGAFMSANNGDEYFHSLATRIHKLQTTPEESLAVKIEPKAEVKPFSNQMPFSKPGPQQGPNSRMPGPDASQLRASPMPNGQHSGPPQHNGMHFNQEEQPRSQTHTPVSSAGNNQTLMDMLSRQRPSSTNSNAESTSSQSGHCSVTQQMQVETVMHCQKQIKSEPDSVDTKDMIRVKTEPQDESSSPACPIKQEPGSQDQQPQSSSSAISPDVKPKLETQEAEQPSPSPARALATVNSSSPKPKKTFRPEELHKALMPSLVELYKLDPDSRDRKSIFREPVDPQALGIPHYFEVIKNPMDLSTIKHKLDHGLYENPWQYVDDVRLMFDNAWLFNDKKSCVYKHCSKVRVKLEKNLPQTKFLFLALRLF